MTRITSSRNLIRIAIIGLLAVLAVFAYGRALAAVTISSFNAQGQSAGILVTWSTGSEINNVGFDVLRSTDQNGTYTKINANLIPGCLCMGGANYQFTDTTAASGQTYFYHLQSVDTSGGRTTTDCVNTCPVSASISGAAATPTATKTTAPPTATNTTPPTATKTPRPPTATNTPRSTSTKTGTAIPGTPTATDAAPTETLAADILPTETIVPDVPLGDLPTATDAPPDSQDSGSVETPVDFTPAPTKFARAANPVGSDPAASPDQTETSTPSPTPLASAKTPPRTGPTSVALRVQPTKVPTQSHPAGKSQAPPPSSSRSLGLTQAQTTIAVGVVILAIALFGLGVLSGMIGLFMWYVRRSY